MEINETLASKFAEALARTKGQQPRTIQSDKDITYLAEEIVKATGK